MTSAADRGRSAADRGRSAADREASAAARGAWLVLVPALACVLLGALPACQGEDDAPPVDGPLAGVRIVFSISVAEEERRAVRAVVERFRRSTGVDVGIVAITAADLPEKLTVEVDAARAARGETLPRSPSVHLFAQDNLALRVLVDRGLVQPLDAVPIPAAVVPAMIPALQDGKRYFLPFRPNVRVAYVNRARFEQAGVEPPRTVAELRVVARRLREVADGTPKVVLPLARGDTAAVTICEWIVAFGGDPLVLNDEGSVAAFTELGGLWSEGLLARESLLAKYDTVVDYLQGETAWLAQNWPFTSGVLADQGLLTRFDVYAGWAGPVRAAHVVGGDVLGVPTGVAGEERKAAVALAEFLMSREAQQELVTRNAWPAIRNDVYADVSAAYRETFAATSAALADGWYRPAVAYWPAVSDAIDEAVQRIIQRGEAVRPVLDLLHGRIAAAALRAGETDPPGS